MSSHVMYVHQLISSPTYPTTVISINLIHPSHVISLKTKNTLVHFTGIIPNMSYAVVSQLFNPNQKHSVVNNQNTM